jgi:hypothetical protein
MYVVYVYIVGGVYSVSMALCRITFDDICAYGPVPIQLSYVEVLFYAYLRLNFLFMAVCLTLVHYFVVLYERVTP